MTTQIETKIYLGMEIATAVGTRVPIPPYEVHAFIQQAVLPRFSALTVLTGHGIWRSSYGSRREYREASTILLIIHADTAKANRNIGEIARSYREIFRQEAVLVTQHALQVQIVRDDE